MLVVKLEIKLDAPWVQSLKEKRMLVKSLCAKLRNKFNLSVAEVAEQDTHKTVVIGIAYVAADTMQADSIADHVLEFLDQNAECDYSVLSREIV